MQHTKEPWPEPQADTHEIYTIDGVGFFDSYADAERAMACVNACAGIDDVGNVQEAFDSARWRGWRVLS